jgi:hypothetical protein
VTLVVVRVPVLVVVDVVLLLVETVVDVDTHIDVPTAHVSNSGISNGTQ